MLLASVRVRFGYGVHDTRTPKRGVSKMPRTCLVCAAWTRLLERLAYERTPLIRHRPPTRLTQIDAVLASPLIHCLAAAVPERKAGRPTRHPLALHLGWAAIARGFGSGNRLDAELASGDMWGHIVERYNTNAAQHPHGVTVDASIDRLYADTHRHTRDRFCETDTLGLLCEAFTEHSVALAQHLGLLIKSEMGSRTLPGQRCTIYGDGTILRPIYSKEAKTRHDPDVITHHRHDGKVVGTKLVHFAVRGTDPHHRVMLAVGHVADPGREADRSVELIRKISAYAPDTISAVAYDGAFRGVHHNLLMTELGIIVINKPHGSRNKTPRVLALGTWSHVTPGGTCEHALVSNGGNVCDATLNETGQAVLSEPCKRTQVRRYDRTENRYRFSLGVTVPCATGAFTAWISPHPAPGDTTSGRADQLRLVSPHEQHFADLYSLRNDSEAINANYKLTHTYDRAPVLGWKRQLFDLLAWSLLNNATAQWYHSPQQHNTQAA